jgi:hypothetical protein
MHMGGGGLGCPLDTVAQPAPRRNTTEDTVVIWEGDFDNGSAETWSLTKHSSGQEPKAVGLEELCRLRREAGNADSSVDGLFLLER